MAEQQRPGEGGALNDALGEVTREANSIFEKMQSIVEERVRGGATSLDVAEIAREVGLELDERALVDLQIDRITLAALVHLVAVAAALVLVVASVPSVVPMLPVVVVSLPLVGRLIDNPASAPVR